MENFVDLKALQVEGVTYVGRNADDGIQDKAILTNAVLLSVDAEKYRPTKDKDGVETVYGAIVGIFKTDKGTKKAVLDVIDMVQIGEAYQIQKRIREKEVKDENGQIKVRKYHGYALM